MQRQLAERNRRTQAATEIIVKELPILRDAIAEFRDKGKVSKRRERKLQLFSKAGRKIYPPRVVFMTMERAFKAGHKEAATAALLFSAKEKVAAPQWALESWAESQRSGSDKKDGRPARHPWVVLWRVWAVERCAKQRKYGRDGEGDKYERAHRLLAKINPSLFAGLPVVASAPAVKKSYYDFLRTRRLGYMSPQFFEGLLQGMLLSSQKDVLRQRN